MKTGGGLADWFGEQPDRIKVGMIWECKEIINPPKLSPNPSPLFFPPRTRSISCPCLASLRVLPWCRQCLCVWRHLALPLPLRSPCRRPPSIARCSRPPTRHRASREWFPAKRCSGSVTARTSGWTARRKKRGNSRTGMAR